MSRWKSPQAAAKEAERLRKERFKDRLMLLGIILLMAATTTAYLVFYAFPRLKKAHRHQHRQRPSSTNAAPVERKP